MASTLCVLAWIAVLIALPLVLLLYFTESRQQRVNRLRSYGWSQQRIADQIGCSRSTVRRILATV